MNLIQKQCKKSSVKVTDFENIKKSIKGIVVLCHSPEPMGKHKSAIAIAHCQVDHDNPLRFFVFSDGEVVINPKILQRSEEKINHKEGCMSFAFRDLKIVSRFLEVDVRYSTFDGDGNVYEKEERVKGLRAFVFQHEIDHMNGKSIYSKRC